MGRYEDFQWVTSRALDFALASLGARLTDGQARRLVELYDHLQPFPDAAPALRALAGIGQVRLVTSNAFDSVGAGAAGMRTAWVNRSAAPFDTIGARPDLTVPALGRLPAALGG